MDDDTRLLSLQLLETVEMVFDHFRPRTLPPQKERFKGEIDSEKRILRRIKRIREKILHPA